MTSKHIEDVDLVIFVRARRHGIADADVLHAYQHPIRVFRLDDLTMLIGPDRAARLLEIGLSTGEGVEFSMSMVRQFAYPVLMP